jgi:hypothetical protein
MEKLKLTKAQRELLLDLSDAQQDSIYCSDHYRPATALVSLGLAVWRRNERLAIAPAGRAALEASNE